MIRNDVCDLLKVDKYLVANEDKGNGSYDEVLSIVERLISTPQSITVPNNWTYTTRAVDQPVDKRTVYAEVSNG